ncbi:SGNH/GDSL hydrolase family protein [Leuconostoc falkenbergense]|uniref:SGNH/GDSL hydrolase family protein n=1 Tax=Leuconostoc falkenbergense TaxID=2766470 RepID=UPI0024AE2F26|nr:SGNH/GDSL hydrolase family protein [Leuconostoc falkenbergense]MDI6666404.1 SGNH/GDSL hydrolase family protein [Leuconostoc falkenbergense]
MDKLKTTELPNGLDQTFRNDLIDNFEAIQNGIDDQSEIMLKEIETHLGGVHLQDQNEVSQARIDKDGKNYETLKSRIDDTQSAAETSLAEERKTKSEVEGARTNNNSKTYESLKKRLDEQENDLTNNMNYKISQISSMPETFSSLVDLKNSYPNGRTGIFVTADTGHKYIWVNNTWTDSGVYQSVGISNNSVTSEMLSGNTRYISIYVNNKSGGAVFNIDSINMTLTSSNCYANFGKHSDLIPTITLNLEFTSNVIYYDFALKVLGVTDYVWKLTSDQALIGIVNQDLSVVDLKVTNYSIDGVDMKTGHINTYIYNNNISGGGKFDIDTVNKLLVVTGAYINHGTNSELIPDTSLSLSNDVNVIYYDFANKSIGVTDYVAKVSNQKELIGIINPDLSVFDLKVTNYSIDGVNVKTSVRDKYIHHNIHFFGDAIVDIDKKTFTANGVYINYDFGGGRSMPNTTLDVSTNTIVYFDTKDGIVKATDQYNKLKDGQFLLGNFQAGWIQGSFFNSFSRILVVKNGITYDAAGYKARNALLLNTYMATFGDSITSDQVSGTGTQIMNALGAKKTGNFATGWSTGSDWHDGTTNTTTVTLVTPNNTDTNDNVLSNQVRRALQYTTASGQQVTWTHPIDGEFSLDKSLGTGLGNTDKLPSVIYIAISTNDGKNASVPIVDDTDDVLAQEYKDLTRNSLASGLRWAIETLQSAYPGVKIFIASPLQARGSSWMNYTNANIKRDIIQKVAKFTSVYFIDSFSESGFSNLTVPAWTVDGVHPSSLGKPKLVDYVTNEIRKKF